MFKVGEEVTVSIGESGPPIFGTIVNEKGKLVIGVKIFDERNTLAFDLYHVHAMAGEFIYIRPTGA